MLGRPWALCAPALIVLIFVALVPLLQTLALSFTQAGLGGISSAEWTGLQNFKTILTDSAWWTAMKNTLVFTAISVLLETTLGLGIALLLHSHFKGKGMLRAAVLVPWAIPTVVSARIWAWMLNDLYGIVNEVLLRLRLIDTPVAWLAEDRLAFATLVLVDVWKSTPFIAFILLAGLQSIPTSLQEASEVDGASPWQHFLYITLPLLTPALWVALIFRTMDALRIFDLPFVLTSNSKSTAVISIYARQQLVDFQEGGLGSAACILVLATVGVVSLVYLLWGRKSLT